MSGFGQTFKIFDHMEFIYSVVMFRCNLCNDPVSKDAVERLNMRRNAKMCSMELNLDL